MKPLLFCLLFIGTLASAADADTPPLQTSAARQQLAAMVVDPTFVSMTLSPDGKRIAALSLN